ncbi:hypothetical protein LWI28_012333 [Acer negundo]|uniref:RNA 3'-terminal phosphate cyclase domain-containing protein n=1 Tax=Acer negundo TaxID=4023 RepID=A0AAD5JDA7_ACENE|nr:hypothetical protein LWI28_012333 [Acer negundo]
MGKSTYKKLKGSQNLRQRLVLSTLASTPFLIEEICPEDTWSGLRPHEVWLLRLVEKVCNDCIVEINKTDIAASLTRAPLHLSLFRGSACTRQSSREFN